MLKGRIIKNISNSYVVKVDDNYYDCKARGKFRNLKETPLVGDLVTIDEENNYILKIEPRKNALNRPHVSNIDIALIVTSLKKPDISLNLLDKEIVSIILENIKPCICFTKLDLLDKKELKELTKLRDYYENIGIKTFTNANLKELKKFLMHKYVVLTGQTGAGKSSLINMLDNTKNIQVDTISEALGRGKHTTRHTEFYQIKDIYIADTPGFSSLLLDKYTDLEIKNTFSEFKDATCKYRDCWHLKEDGCQIKEKVAKKEILESRYRNYISFLKEVK